MSHFANLVEKLVEYAYEREETSFEEDDVPLSMHIFGSLKALREASPISLDRLSGDTLNALYRAVEYIEEDEADSFMEEYDIENPGNLSLDEIKSIGSLDNPHIYAVAREIGFGLKIVEMNNMVLNIRPYVDGGMYPALRKVSEAVLIDAVESRPAQQLAPKMKA